MLLVVEASQNGVDLPAWISAVAACIAAVAAFSALIIARGDLRKTKKELRAQLTYQVNKDVLDLISRSGGKSPKELLLFYFSIFNLIDAGLLPKGTEELVLNDIGSAKGAGLLDSIWKDASSKAQYPKDFQKFIDGVS